MNIQDEVIKIHDKYGITEKANYEIQLLFERYAKEYHETEERKLGVWIISKDEGDFCGVCNNSIYTDEFGGQVRTHKCYKCGK